jgi:hypothetical protein
MNEFAGQASPIIDAGLDHEDAKADPLQCCCGSRARDATAAG